MANPWDAIRKSVESGRLSPDSGLAQMLAAYDEHKLEEE